jgi:hypothetical protein
LTNRNPSANYRQQTFIPPSLFALNGNKNNVEKIKKKENKKTIAVREKNFFFTTKQRNFHKSKEKKHGKEKQTRTWFNDSLPSSASSFAPLAAAFGLNYQLC